MIILHESEVKHILLKLGYLLLSDGKIVSYPSAWTFNNESVGSFPPSAARGSYVRGGGRRTR